MVNILSSEIGGGDRAGISVDKDGAVVMTASSYTGAVSYKPGPEVVAALTAADPFLGKVIESVQNPGPEGVPAPVSWLIPDTD